MSIQSHQPCTTLAQHNKHIFNFSNLIGCKNNRSNLIGCENNDAFDVLYCDTTDHRTSDWTIPKRDYCGLLCVKENLENGRNFVCSKPIKKCFSETVAEEFESFLTELRNTLHSANTNCKNSTEEITEKVETNKTDKNENKNRDNDDDTETRRIIEMSCIVEHSDETEPSLTLLLRFDDKMNRQLSCRVAENETALDLANELVEYGLINKLDQEKVARKIAENLNSKNPMD